MKKASQKIIKTLFIFTFFVTLSQHILFAQSPELEAKQALADSLAYQASEFYNNDDYNSADSCASAALELSKSIGYQKGIAAAYNAFGINYVYQSRYSEGKEYLFKSLKIYETLGDSIGALSSLTTLGAAFSEQGQYTPALTHYFRALHISEFLKDTVKEARLLNNIANVYSEQSNFDEALKFYNSALKAFENLNNNRGISILLVNIASTEHQMKRNDDALKSYNRSLEIRRKLGDIRGVANTLIGIADVYFDLKQYAKAKLLYQESLDILKKLSAPRLYTYALKGLGKVYLATGEPKKGIPFAKQSLAIADSIHVQSEIKDAAFLLSSLYEKLGEASTALKYFKVYSDFKDTVLSQESLKAAANFREQYEVAKKEREIAELSITKAEQQLEIASQRITQNQFIAGVIILVISLVALSFFSYVKQKSENEIRQKNEALALALKEKEEQRAEAERQRKIAYEAVAFKDDLIRIAAHDLKNPLQSVLGYSEILQEQTKLDKPITTQNLDMIRRIFLSSDRMLSLIKDLLDSAPKAFGMELNFSRVDLPHLIKGVIELNDYQKSRKGQSIVFETDCNSFIAEVDKEKFKEVVDNLISNAIKYSPPGKTIWVNFESPKSNRDGNGSSPLRISIKDEGQGLTAEDQAKLFGRFQKLSAKPTGGESSSGLGLYIAKKLITDHGGDIYAHSQGKGAGSTFFIELPVSSH
ncbi:MAG: tetratricopeptide repeat-containing sensor histidine kinase [Chloroherpetonaceae bacterium]|nr:tetratricopeptide repeat-containing sensor histidine kinase [Chloroherpetonaceae bacterium]